MKRKIVMLNGHGEVYLREEELPAPAPTEVLVETACALISPGTEIGSVKGLRKNPREDLKPFPLGYSSAGTVKECGAKVKRLEPKMHVACMGDNYASYADASLTPVNMAAEIPAGVTFEEAVFAHLGATSLQAVRRAELELGENVLVVGLGIVGNIAGQLAKMCGCHVIGSDFFPLRREVALKTGFDAVIDPKTDDFEAAVMEFNRGRGLDCALICFGGDGTEVLERIYSVMKQAPDTHRYGRVVIPGGIRLTTGFAAALGNVDLRSSARTGPGFFDPKYEHGGDYPPVFVKWTTQRNLEEFLRAVAEERVATAPLITHRFPLDEAPKACDLLIDDPESAMGVILQAI